MMPARMRGVAAARRILASALLGIGALSGSGLATGSQAAPDAAPAATPVRRPTTPPVAGAAASAVTSASAAPAVVQAAAQPARVPASAALETLAVQRDAQVARGRYLALAADCAACHKSDANVPFVGGAPLNSPFGKIYASNITPDAETGIGRYTRDDFEAALRRGIARGGKRLYPAMPYASFARMSDGDIDALYAYFMKGVVPVQHVVPATRLPFPFNQRWALALWDGIFVEHQRFVPDRSRDALWNRGAYLVQGAGHCGACHTPRGPAYEERGYDESSRRYLTGAVNDHWFAPNLTGRAADGLGRWSETELTRFLATGHGNGAIAFGAMGPVVTESLQYLEQRDVQAIAHYLKSLAPRGGSTARYASASSEAQRSAAWLQSGSVELPGAGLYANFCARCHRIDGRGQDGYPALAGSSLVLADDATSLVRLVLEGGHSPEVNGMPRVAMPAFGQHLNDEQIAQVVGFVRNSWGNRAVPPTTRAVTRLRATLRKQ
ncbi:Cytochrome c, mono-and diheme variants [Chitinasiproducens palmae]|uniref:Cytochrome c, mono-and diheme variants n=2 Tax=Chitinasiproducens palmae TaxID=1770053 RepID=A0A1H2PJW9_9BURK|nr:Cytochrome c, mono-and diheme variants [Chitinasiproducens palmae]